MRSSEPLGTPPPDYPDTQEAEIIILDGPEKPGDAEVAAAAGALGKRKRGILADDKIQAFSSMTKEVWDVAQAIRDNKPTDMHPDLYNAVMYIVGFAEEHLMVALGHIIDHKVQGTNFVGMRAPHRILWLRTFLAKYSIDPME